MTDTQLTWIGIVSQAIPTITAIFMVTVGKWMIKRRELKYHRNNVNVMSLTEIEMTCSVDESKEIIKMYLKNYHNDKPNLRSEP